MLCKKRKRFVFVNFVFCLSFLFLFSSVSGQRTKIPIDVKRWYQLGSVNSGFEKLFDGNTQTVYFPGWNLLVSPYDAYYPLHEGEEMTIDSIRMYDRENIYTNTPLKLYAITDTWEQIPLGTFTGERYLVCVGPDPARPSVFKLDSAVKRIRYLMLKAFGNGFPAELEFYGTYTPPPVAAMPPVVYREPLKRMFGINGFAWNVVDRVNSDIVVIPARMKVLESFGVFRQYLDWPKSEPVEGRYFFSPQEGGGWPLDTIYKVAMEADLEMVATIQNIPQWLMNTYPDSLQSIDNNPLRYGYSLTEPASYVEMGKLAFQFAARYGRNKNIDSGLVSVYTVPAWPNQKVNTKKIGLGLVKYIECGNEVDKNWRGRKGYLTGREYAANLSAFYDGHVNTLGPGVGVKQADSTMQVVMTGVAYPSTEYFRGIVDWCREFRGYKPDGRVNLCFDVINYHFYSSDRGLSQIANGTRGVAPEKGLADSIARQFVEASNQYAYGLPVWITEQGYDLHQGSPVKAIPVGNRTAAETQADWILRSALLYARRGLHRSFFYQLFDLNVESATKYASMGLADKFTVSRKPAADFLFQTIKLFGEYCFQETLNTDPFIDRYEKKGRSMFVLAVPDEVGRTASVNLSVPAADSVSLYRPVVGSDEMSKQRLAVTNGQLQLTVTETPMFIVPDSVNANSLPSNSLNPSGAAHQHLSSLIAADRNLIDVHPNPANSQLYISNKAGGRWNVVLMDLRGNKIREAIMIGDNATFGLSNIASGIYALYLLNEKQEVVHSQFIIKH